MAATTAFGLGLSAKADVPTAGDFITSSGVDISDITFSAQGIHVNAPNQVSFIEWSKFNLDHPDGAFAQFDLPDGGSRILNLVTGGDLSNINGHIGSNGFVFLVNPAGVTFGSGTKLDVAGFYAAAANMDPNDFLNGDLHFTDAEGTVRVLPGTTLEADVLHLLGRHVINEGTLKSNGGIIGMFAGNDIFFGEENGRVFVKIDGTTLDGHGSFAGTGSGPNPNIAGTPGIDNIGTVDVGAGRAFLGAGDLFSLAIRNQGNILAEGGEINIAAAGGAVHQKDGNLKSDILTLAGDEIHLNTDLKDIENELTFYDPVILRSTVELNADQILAHSTIDGLQEGLQNLKLLGNVTLLDAVGQEKSLGDFLLLGGSLFIGGDLINTRDDQSYMGIVTLGNEAVVLRSAVGQVQFLAPIQALSTGQQGLTVEGFLLINARVGEDSPLKYLIADGTTVISTDLIRTVGDQQYLGVVTLATSSLLEALDDDSVVWFHDTLDSLQFPGQGLAINGNARFDGEVGGGFLAGNSRELDWLEIAGNAEINTGLIRTANHQTYGGDVTLGDNATLMGTTMWFQSMVDALNEGGQSLRVMGNAEFDGDVGSNYSLAGLVVDQNATIRGVLIQTTGSQEYGDALSNTFVLIDGDTTLRGLNTNLTFNSTIDDVAAGHSILELDGNVQFNDLVGQNTPLNSLIVLGTTDLNTSAVTTTNLQSYVGDVLVRDDATLTSHIMDFGSAIDDESEGAHSLVLWVGDTLRLGGDVGGNTRLGLFEINAGGVTTIEGEQILTTGDIRFNPNGKPGVPDVATFAGMTNLLIDSQDGSFFMGQHEKLSVLGHLVINAEDGTATLGDLNSLGNMTVNAPGIFLHARQPAELLRFDGTRITDFGVDFVAGGDIVFTSQPQLLGPGFGLFASETGVIDLSGAEDQFFLVSGKDVTREMFFFGDIVLDLTALDVLQDNLAEVLEDADLELEDIVLPDPLRLILLDVMANLNLHVRDMRSEEYGDRLAGRDLYDDSANMIIEDPAQRQVAINRLRRASVVAVIDTYIDLFLDVEIDEVAGVYTNIVDRRSDVRESFEAAWNEYAAQAEAPDADGFREYLLNEYEHEQMRNYMVGMERIFRELAIMGLTPGEYESASAAVLQPILPEELSWRAMYTAIINGDRG